MTIYNPPVKTYDTIAFIALASTTASVILSGFDQSYRDLILTVSGTTTSGDTSIKMQFNGDTGASYPYVRLYSESAGLGSDSNTLGDIRGIMGATTGVGHCQFHIMDFSDSGKFTTVLSNENNMGIDFMASRINRWSNTDPVAAITLTPTSGSFSAGTVFQLSGVKA